jgi:hypothetical protein
MKIQFSYDQDRNVQNYIKASGSVNSKRPSKMQAMYIDEYGEIFEEDKLKAFISAYIQRSGLDMNYEAKRMRADWRSVEQFFLERVEAIFGVPAPAGVIQAFLTTDTRCSYSIRENYFFVSVFHTFPNKTIMHELLHFWTWWRFGKEVENGSLTESQYNNIKESLTVILNVEFTDVLNGEVDEGYPQHRELREAIRSDWLATKNIEHVFTVAKRFVAVRSMRI